MADVQKEYGHTDYANTFLEALAKTRIPGEARQVFDLISRKTWGWHKTEDRISLSQFCDGTGLSKVHVCQAITTLLRMNLIFRKNISITENGNVTEFGNREWKVYGIQKDFDKWIPLPKKVTLPKKVISITEFSNKPLPNSGTTKENYTKENTKEKKSPIDFFGKEKKKGNIAEKLDDQTLKDLKPLLEYYKTQFPDFNCWGFIQKNIEKHPRAFLVTFRRVKESLERGNPIKTNIRAILQSVLNGESKHFHEADNIQAHEQRKAEWSKLYPRFGSGGDYGLDPG